MEKQIKMVRKYLQMEHGYFWIDQPLFRMGRFLGLMVVWLVQNLFEDYKIFYF